MHLSLPGPCLRGGGCPLALPRTLSPHDGEFLASHGWKEALRILASNELRIISSGNNNDPAHLRLHSEDTSISINDRVGQIRFAGRDAGGSTVSRTGALIQATASNAWDTNQTSGYSATHLEFFTQNNSGTDTIAASPRLRINSTGETTLCRINTFPNPNNTGSEILGSKLVFGAGIKFEERYPNGAYTDRQDLVLRANRGYGLGEFDNIRFTAGGMINIENKTITGGNNLAIQNFTVRGVWSGTNSIGKSIELISGYDSSVKMAAIGYNLTDVNNGSTYGGDLTFYTQPLYSSPTSPIPERMRISSSGYITKSVVPCWNLRPYYNSTQTTSNTSSHHAIGWSDSSSGNGATNSKACFLQNCTLHGSGFTYNLHNGQNYGKLRVPVAGRYYVNVTYRVENNPVQGNIYVYVNATQIARQHVEMWAHRPYMHCQWASVLNLDKNDEILISISCANANVSGRNDNVNWFSGYLIG